MVSLLMKESCRGHGGVVSGAKVPMPRAWVVLQGDIRPLPWARVSLLADEVPLPLLSVLGGIVYGALDSLDVLA